MKEIYVKGENGSVTVDRSITVEDARELVDAIKNIASVDMGVKSYMINNTSGSIVAPIGIREMEEEFDAICSVQIVPFNKAGAE